MDENTRKPSKVNSGSIAFETVVNRIPTLSKRRSMQIKAMVMSSDRQTDQKVKTRVKGLNSGDDIVSDVIMTLVGQGWSRTGHGTQIRVG